MILFQYPATIVRCADGEVILRFPNLNGTITGAGTERETLEQAADLFGSAIAHSIAEKEHIRPPSPLKRGQRAISVPLWIAGKLAVYQAMQEAGITNVDLAIRLGVTDSVVRRILEPDHETRGRKLAAALAALGKELVPAVAPRRAVQSHDGIRPFDRTRRRGSRDRVSGRPFADSRNRLRRRIDLAYRPTCGTPFVFA